MWVHAAVHAAAGCLLDNEEVFRVRILIFEGEVNCAFRDDLHDFSLYNPAFFLFSRDLLYHDNLVAELDELLCVFIHGSLREPAVKLLVREGQVEDLLTDHCVFVEDLVEFSHLEEEDLIEVLALELPVLTHHLRHASHLALRDV